MLLCSWKDLIDRRPALCTEGMDQKSITAVGDLHMRETTVIPGGFLLATVWLAPPHFVMEVHDGGGSFDPTSPPFRARSFARERR